MPNDIDANDISLLALSDAIRTLPLDERRQLWRVLDAEQVDNSAEDNVNSLAVRRELAAASVAALGDFWDNEVDREWQDFQP